MNNFIELLNSEIQEISAKKFNSKVASTNFSDFQRELAHCLFSEFVIEVDNDEEDEMEDDDYSPPTASTLNDPLSRDIIGDCPGGEHSRPAVATSHPESPATRMAEDDEERQQILQFITKHLEDFAARYDNIIVQTCGERHSENAPQLESTISSLFPAVSPKPSSSRPNLEAWSDAIETAVTSSWDTFTTSSAVG